MPASRGFDICDMSLPPSSVLTTIVELGPNPAGFSTWTDIKYSVNIFKSEIT